MHKRNSMPQECLLKPLNRQYWLRKPALSTQLPWLVARIACRFHQQSICRSRTGYHCVVLAHLAVRYQKVMGAPCMAVQPAAASRRNIRRAPGAATAAMRHPARHPLHPAQQGDVHVRRASCTLLNPYILYAL